MARQIITKEQIIESNGNFEGNNKIIGNFELHNSKIIFEGDGNVLISNADRGSAKLVNAILAFKGNNSVVFLGESGANASYQIDLQVYNDNYCYIGNYTRFNGYSKVIDIVCAEKGNLFIGDDCGIANAARFQMSDIHPIFDGNSKERVNHAKSVFIGDHVWIGPDARIMKGTQIGSGSIIGLNSVVSGKVIPSNVVWGGNPAHPIKENIMFSFEATNIYTTEEIEAKRNWQGENYLFENDNTVRNFTEIENDILIKQNALDRAKYLLDFSKKTDKNKNRFYIGTNS